MHTLIRNEIEEYNSKNESEKCEVIVCEDLGYRNIDGIGEVFIVGKYER